MSDAPAWALVLAAKLDAIGARLAKAAPRAVLSTREAAEMVGLGDDAFRVWADRWRVLPCGHGRWALHRINAGLERESRQGARKPRRPSRAKAGKPEGAQAA